MPHNRGLLAQYESGIYGSRKKWGEEQKKKKKPYEWENFLKQCSYY